MRARVFAYHQRHLGRSLVWQPIGYSSLADAISAWAPTTALAIEVRLESDQLLKIKRKTPA